MLISKSERSLNPSPWLNIVNPLQKMVMVLAIAILSAALPKSYRYFRRPPPRIHWATPIRKTLA